MTYLRTWMHEDELRPGASMPAWLIKTARSAHERRLLLGDWYCFWGYHDARDGLGMREGFDKWEQPRQETYQCGRALVALMRSEGFPPPEWLDRLEPGPVLDWFNDRRRRYPDELLLPRFTGANNAHA